ncbi:MAG: hypothetical protein COS82_03940 [Zetaproteobacteria bacterium CG06_land_8_20_14_3_00_59_53]|nr:MAG: hypothetical protein AUK36_08620 [Zetaproteobacteria bacterium CG2_30_59_37]PIO89137.1 MAG: hypothetical protein COX56_09320 [Zetaproteobacteria bacterium CG23_combo_of_CG06-09_8_20_14_all_59_86]PIQ64450.1 MAG: hypothetical protein COV97_09130 [Zetaproteobacteria bacterium CG11_big_fil_rev_8_21_14_0_20_59_439]PIU70876.1 MAG: hypothetical protein COS82_03940 [Zetaproteobacteria bacterium CG06_land_8_20_14_3_00_59_53]PIU96313.1 MAG: hypothetical protein COS62_09510 [Zetaproteobacteria bac
MPQFNASLSTPELIWTIVVFAVAYGLLKYMILPRLAAALDRRSRAIEAEIEQTRRLREQTEQQSNDFRRLLEEAGQDVDRMIDESKERVQQTHEQLMAACEADIKQQGAAFHEEAEARRLQAMQDIRSDAAKMAADDTAELEPIDKKKAGKLLDEILAENATKARKH